MPFYGICERFDYGRFSRCVTKVKADMRLSGFQASESKFNEVARRRGLKLYEDRSFK